MLTDKTGQEPRTVVLTGAKEIGKREIVQRWVQMLQNCEEPPLIAQSSHPPA